MRKISIIAFSMLFMIWFFGVQSAVAANLSDCSQCHGTKVRDFNVTSVERSQTCAVCHNDPNVNEYHPYPYYQAVLVKDLQGNTLGYFKDASAAIVGAPGIHNNHSGLNTPSNSNACARCHKAVNCSTCHTSVAHEQHGSSVPITLPSYTMGNGVAYGTTTLTCSTSNCHNYYKPGIVVKKTDGSDLCYNCHSTGYSGHSNIELPHQTNLNYQLVSLPNQSGPFVVNCNQCHDSVLYTEHSGKVNDCNNCHGENVRSDVKAVVDAAMLITDPAANAEAIGCFKCHPNPPLKHQPLHAAVEDGITDITVYHADCNTCHANASVSAAVYGLARSNDSYSCFDCHGGTDLEAPVHKAVFSGNNTEYALPGLHNSCATCHEDAAIKTTVGNISSQLKSGEITSYNCNVCHTGAMQPIHSAAMTAGGTAQDTVSFHPDCETCHSNSKVSAALPQLKAAGSYLCTDCHNGQIASNAKHMAATTAGGEAVDTVGYHAECGTCHSNPKAQAKVSSLKSAGSYQCWACHNGDVAPAAKHSATYDQNGTEYNTPELHPSCDACHKSTDANVKTQIKTLAAQPGAAYTCTVCHTGSLAPRHQALLQDGGSSFETTAFHPSCATCHSKESVVAVVGTLKAKNPYLCTDCHNGQVTSQPLHQAKLEASGENLDTTAFHSNCATCHSYASAQTTIASLKGTSGYLCSKCHNGTVAPNANHQAKYDAASTPEPTVSLHPSCATCHSNATVAPTIAKLKGTTDYQCSECHGDLGVKHVSTVSTYPVDCTWCHSGNLVDAHLKPTIKLNATYTCNTCHGSSSPVKNQIALGLKQCTDCHNGTAAPVPHTSAQYVPRHTNNFSDFLSEYTPNCATCHSSSFISFHNDVPAPNGPVSCDVCHTNQTYKPAVVALNTNCAGCHQDTMVTRHQTPHTVDTVKYQSSQGCLSCHATTGNNLLAVHKANPDSAVTCDSCHGSAARADAKLAVANKDLSCQACHKGDSHNHPVAATGYSASPEVSCQNCHSTDIVSKTAELSLIHKNAATAGKIANYSCATCHNTTFEGVDNVISKDGNLDMKRSGVDIYCADCHNGTKAHALSSSHQPEHKAVSSENVTCNVCHDGTTVKGSFNAAAGTAVDFTAIHTSNGCDTCHDNTKVTEVIKAKVGTANTAYDCALCHDGTKAGTHNKQHTVKTYLNGSTDTSCASCHKNGDVVAVHSGTSGSGNVLNCDTCHNANPALASTVSVIKANLSSNANRSGYTCQSCHTDIAGGHNHPVALNSYAAAPNVDCSKCHATETNGTAELAEIHKKAADQGKIANYGCSTCHNSNFVGAGKVILGDGSIDMKQNGTTAIYCNSCHNGTLAHSLDAKYPAHAGNHINSTGYGTYKGTYNGQAFDDSAVDCSKCHASLDTKVVHDSALHTNVNCNSCHQSTNEAVKAVIAGAWSRATTKAAYTCSSCHATLPYKHQPDHTGTTAEAASLNCQACHSNTAWTGNNAKVVSVHNDNCNTCHASTNTVVNTFITANIGKVNTAYACESCHTTGGALAKDTAHQPEHLAKNNTTNMTCSSCHSFNMNAGQAVDIKSAAIHKDCNTCHGSAAPESVKLFIASKKGLSNPAYSCEDCHGVIHVGWEAKHSPVLPADPAMNCASCHDNYLPDEHQKALTASASAGVGYQVLRSTTATGPWTVIGSTTATGYADTGLAANTTYYYQVKAYDGKPNYSGVSNTLSVKTLANTASAVTVNPALARYASSSNGDSSGDPSSTTDALTRLTDNSTSTYYSTRENGSSDQYIFVKVNNDAANYTKVELKLSVRYYNSTNLTIYPYMSNGTSINTSTTTLVDGPVHSSSSSYITETIDVTKAAQAMEGFGWMKFRIKPDPSKSAYVYIANAQLVLSQSAASGGTATNPPGTLTPNSSDTTAPSAPSGLTGTAAYYDRVDLTWTASTDSGGVSGDTCSVCHSAATRQNAKDAVAAGNANCSACHTIHGDINTAHTGNPLATSPRNCTGCHSNVLSVEHSAQSKLKQNGDLNCGTCHNSTKPLVQKAINSTATDKSNLACTACHTGTADGVPAVGHMVGTSGDLNEAHLTGIFPTATSTDCLNCHSTQQAEFNTSYASFHAVSGTSKASSGYGVYKNGWTATSKMECTSCHAATTAGGTTAYANILPKAYTYTSGSGDSNMLCYTCHDYATYGGGSDSSGKTGFGDSGKNLHNIGDHKNNGRLQCSWCHSAVPHGINRPHLIALTTDPKPYSNGNVLYKYVHATPGNYSVSDCGSSVSMCDEHR